MDPRIIALICAGAIVALTGVWLTITGTPFGVALQTVHKLVALAAVVFVGVLVFQLARDSGITPAAWGIIAGAGAVVVLAFATGGAVSASAQAPAWVVWTHRIGSWASMAGVGAVVVAVLATA